MTYSVVLKYRVTLDHLHMWRIELPDNHKILHFGTQLVESTEVLYCWVLQDDSILKPKWRKFLITNTGEKIFRRLDTITFVQTVVYKHMKLVLHIFELTGK